MIDTTSTSQHVSKQKGRLRRSAKPGYHCSTDQSRRCSAPQMSYPTRSLRRIRVPQRLFTPLGPTGSTSQSMSLMNHRGSATRESSDEDDDHDEEITLRPGAGTALDGTEAEQVDSVSEAQRDSLACERLLAHFAREAGDRRTTC